MNWIFSVLALVVICLDSLVHGSTWSEWWTYEGISGPGFWGLVNPEWSYCVKGRKQSPIDIDPSALLHDPNLRHLHIDKHHVGGVLMNTGHDIMLQLDDTGTHAININGGPYVYRYRVTELHLHWGNNDTWGSEHTIDGNTFPAEIQILAYNMDLYGNLTQATYSTDGLAMIALLVQVGRRPNKEFDKIAQELWRVRYKGSEARIHRFFLHELLPKTHEFMTYQGSLTQPGCQETVTWVVLNKPIFITHHQLEQLREVMQGDEKIPKVQMMNNCRPTMDLNYRTVHTNIDFAKPSKDCTMEKKLFYQAKNWTKT